MPASLKPPPQPPLDKHHRPSFTYRACLLNSGHRGHSAPAGDRHGCPSLAARRPRVIGQRFRHVFFCPPLLPTLESRVRGRCWVQFAVRLLLLNARCPPRLAALLALQAPRTQEHHILAMTPAALCKPSAVITRTAASFLASAVADQQMM